VVSKSGVGLAAALPRATRRRKHRCQCGHCLFPIALRRRMGQLAVGQIAWSFEESVRQLRTVASDSAPMNGKKLRQVCCEKLGIPSEAFEERVLWQCFYPRHVLLGKLLWCLNRKCFNDDLELIRLAGNCTSLSEVRTELGAYRYQHPPSGFRRRVLKARVSGRRLLNFAAKFIP
jgi:hypothetical protein